MIDLYDPAEAAERARRDRRRFIAYSIGEWMNTKRHPKLTVFFLLAICGGVAWGVDHFLAGIGIELRSFRWMPAMLVCWPVFVFLLRWRASVEWQALKSDPIFHTLGLDRRGNADDGAPISPLLSHLDDAIREMQGTHPRATHGSGGLLPLLILGLLTLGGWLLWDLFWKSSKLLADCLIDTQLIPAGPEFEEQIDAHDWMREAFGTTGIHFLGWALAGFLLAPAWPLILRFLVS